ncbi:class IV lanthionine synthetase LanL [Actinomadura gamaensis]|uniref:non-specific serine/threonine protein kinase n=1 Tax=Actinomadura gamaensis TaxID=1763541 RepID=A0ABV9UAT8_9ACTN
MRGNVETTRPAADESLIDEVTGLLARDDWRLEPTNTWILAWPPRPLDATQGWKLHVAARPGTLRETLRRAVPVLERHGCAFKVVKDLPSLAALNAPNASVTSVGKAITVYPEAGIFREVARDLGEALAGMEAPPVRSDRRLRPDSPVYYRYGPFAPRYSVDVNGRPMLVVTGPEGEEFPGAAGRYFACPPWERDPFEPAPAPFKGGGAGACSETPILLDGSYPSPDGARRVVLADRYELVSGVQNSARGRIYRGRDLHTGDAVFIKEAHAYVGGDDADTDCRANLRHERRVLEALDPFPGVPGVVDHFQLGQDEFLVLASVGCRNLFQDVVDHGVYLDGPAEQTLGERGLGRLAGRLAELLNRVHERGVIVRDLSPKNVVLDDSGGVWLVDFEIARLDGHQRQGYTRGYSAPGQRRNRPAQVEDDYFALGATLYYAAIGSDPVMIHQDEARNARQSLAALACAYPDGGPTLDHLPGLLDAARAARAAAFDTLRHGRPAAPAARTSSRASERRPLPADPEDRSKHLLGATLHSTVRHAERMLRESTGTPVRTDAWQGVAGPGTELLHHLDSGTDVRTLVLEMARHAASSPILRSSPPGLLFGRTGTALFLASAARRLGDDALLDAVQAITPPDPDRLSEIEIGDFATGLAGIGTGHLALSALTGDDAHLRVAAECARRLTVGDFREPVAETVTPPAAVVVGLGYAHGRAGIASFLLAHHAATGDPTVLPAIDEHYTALLRRLPELLTAITRPAARPMSASWCQGLAGIGTSLLHAATALGDDACRAAALQAATASLHMVPRMHIVTQCCGSASIGELFVDLAAATGDDTHLQQAHYVLRLMTARCGGTPDQPEYPDNSLTATSAAWGTGSSGILTFLRRLHQPTTIRPWTSNPTTASSGKLTRSHGETSTA